MNAKQSANEKMSIPVSKMCSLGTWSNRRNCCLPAS